MRRRLAAGLDSTCICLPDEQLERATIQRVAAEVIPAGRRRNAGRAPLRLGRPAQGFGSGADGL